MNKNKLLLACVGLLSLTSNLVFAGNRPGEVTFSVAESYYHFAPKRNLDNTAVPNIALAYNFNKNWAVEGGIGLINTTTTSANLDPNKSVHGFLYTVDGLYRFHPYQRFEPYVSAGVGVIGLKPNANSSIQQGNVNAGIGSQYFISDSIAFRAEARDIYTMSGGKNDYMLNLGISFLFDGCSPACTCGKPQPVKAEHIDYKGEK